MIYLLASVIIVFQLLGLAVIYIMTEWGKETKDLEDYKKYQNYEK